MRLVSSLCPNALDKDALLQIREYQHTGFVSTAKFAQIAADAVSCCEVMVGMVLAFDIILAQLGRSFVVDIAIHIIKNIKKGAR
jgi:hypothetical protein